MKHIHLCLFLRCINQRGNHIFIWREIKLSRTSRSAMVTNDWQQVVSGDLGRTLFSQEGSHVKALQREGYVAADLEWIHHLVPKTFQVNAQNLHNTFGHKHIREGPMRKPVVYQTREREDKDLYLWKSEYFAVFHTIPQPVKKEKKCCVSIYILTNNLC